MDLFSVVAWKLLVFCVADRIALGFCVGGPNSLYLVWGSNLTWFEWSDRSWFFFCGGRKWLGSSVWIEINLVCCAEASKLTCNLEWGSNLTWFQVVRRNQLNFCARDRFSLDFCVGGRNWLDFFVGDWTWLDFSVWIGIDLVFVWGGREMLGFSVWIEVNNGFCVGASKLTWFYSGDRIDLISVVASKLAWLLCGDQIWLRYSVGIEICLFLCGGSKLTCVRAEMDLFLVWWSIDLVFVCGWIWLCFWMRSANRLVEVLASKLAWFLCGWSK